MVGFRAHGGGEFVSCIIQQPKGTVQQFIDRACCYNNNNLYFRITQRLTPIGDLLFVTVVSSEVLHSDHIRQKIRARRSEVKNALELVENSACLLGKAHLAESNYSRKNFLVEERWRVIYSKRILTSTWLRRLGIFGDISIVRYLSYL